MKKKRTPRDVLRVVIRHRGLFLVGMALFAIAALAAVPHVEYFEKEYTGTAKVELRTDAAASQQRGREAESFESIKSMLQYELKGRTAIENAIEELGLTKGLPRDEQGLLTPEGNMARQKLVKRIQDTVKVTWDLNVRTDQVDLVSVEFTHKDPEVARQIPNTLVHNYINRVSDDIVGRLTASRDFLQKQVENVEKRLAVATRNRSDFEAQHGGMLPESPGALQERLRELSANSDTVRLHWTEAQQKLAGLEALAKKAEENPDEPVQVIKGPNPELERLQVQLRDYKEDLQNARTLSHMTERHPTVVTLKEKIAEVEKQIEETPEETVLQRVFGEGRGSENLSMALAAARAEADMLESELERLQKQIDSLQGLISNFSPIRQQYLDILNKVQDLELEKKNWQNRLSNVEMSLSAEVAKRRTHLKAVQLAQKPFQPSSPSLKKILGFALGGGLLVGIGLVLLANWADRSVWTPQDAETTFGVPVCGVIGEIIPPGTRLWRGTRRFVIEPTIVLVLLAAVGIGSLNVVLWLQYPEQYAEWTAAPLAYLGERAPEIWSSIRQAL